MSHELYQVSEDMYLHLDLPHRILNSLASYPQTVQARLLSNIILTGGNCRLTGLAARLTADLEKCLPEELVGSLRVVDPRLMTGRSDAVIGASYIKKWPHTKWITRRDYVMNRLDCGERVSCQQYALRSRVTSDVSDDACWDVNTLDASDMSIGNITVCSGGILFNEGYSDVNSGFVPANSAASQCSTAIVKSIQAAAMSDCNAFEAVAVATGVYSTGDEATDSEDLDYLLQIIYCFSL